jgi:hypothetical protein
MIMTSHILKRNSRAPEEMAIFRLETLNSLEHYEEALPFNKPSPKMTIVAFRNRIVLENSSPVLPRLVL